MQSDEIGLVGGRYEIIATMLAASMAEDGIVSGAAKTVINKVASGQPIDASDLKPGTETATNQKLGSALDRIYTSTTSLNELFPEMNGINPYYVENAGAGVNTNCVSCANAAQARLTGQDPNAVATPSNGYSNQNSLLPSAPFGFGSPTSPASVVAEMLQAGNGAVRPLIIMQPGKVDHVINVVNSGGQIYFIDSQIGKIVTLQPSISVRLGNQP